MKRDKNKEEKIGRLKITWNEVWKVEGFKWKRINSKRGEKWGLKCQDDNKDEKI